MSSTTRKRASPDIKRSWAFGASSNGNISIIGATPCAALNAMFVSFSRGVPVRLPTIDRPPKMRSEVPRRGGGQLEVRSAWRPMWDSVRMRSIMCG